MSQEPKAKSRPISESNPNTLSVLVRVTPALRDALDGWLNDVNRMVSGPRWSRTDLIRVALEQAVRVRPVLGSMLNIHDASADAAPPENPVVPLERPVAPKPHAERPKAPRKAVTVEGKRAPLDQKALRKRFARLGQATPGMDRALSEYLEEHGETITASGVGQWRRGDGDRSWESRRLALVSVFLEDHEASRR